MWDAISLSPAAMGGCKLKAGTNADAAETDQIVPGAMYELA